MTTAQQYFADHPNEKEGVLKAWYAYHAPHFHVMPDVPLHNFTSSQRWSKCSWCGRTREEVRHDEKTGRCLGRPNDIPSIKDVLRDEEEKFGGLMEKARTVVPGFLKRHELNGETLAILHHTHGYDPETVEAMGYIVTSQMRQDYEIFMEKERKRSQASHKKEIVMAVTK